MDKIEDTTDVMSMPKGQRDKAIVQFLCTQPWAIMPAALETLVTSSLVCPSPSLVRR